MNNNNYITNHPGHLTRLFIPILVLLLCASCSTGGSHSSSITSSSDGDSVSTSESIVYEESAFSDQVYAFSSSDDINNPTYVDYDSSTSSFARLVDRELTIIASEIIYRLNDIYGSDNYQYSTFYEDVSNFTSWDMGQARGKKYQVYQEDDTYYVFLFDEKGQYIEDEVNGFPFNNQLYKAVYYQDDTYNNLKDYPSNPSSQVLVAFLLNNLTESDTYSSINYSDYDVKEQNLSILQGSIYGDNIYIQTDNEIVLDSFQYDYMWNWSSYFESGTAVDRLKYNLALIVSNKGYFNHLNDMSDYPYDESSYQSLISNIPFLDDYAGLYEESISYFISNFIIGSSLIEQDNLSISSLNSILSKSSEYRKTFEYAIDNNEYKTVLESIRDTENTNYKGKQYSLNDLYEEENLYNNYKFINAGSGNRNFEDEYIYLLGILEIDAESYISSRYNDRYKPYFDIYYGINESGYIDEERTVKSFNQIEFPYDWSSLVSSRNIKNYELTIKDIIQSISSQTFNENNDASNYGLTDISIHPSTYRLSFNDDINYLNELAHKDKNNNIEFLYKDYFNAFIIPACNNVRDLSHYELNIDLGELDKDVDLSIRVCSTDDVDSDNIVTLNSSHLVNSSSISANDELFTLSSSAQYSSLSFRLPSSLTPITYNGEMFEYDNSQDSSIYSNTVSLMDDKYQNPLPVLNNIKDSLVIYFTLYDRESHSVLTNVDYGVCISLDNVHRVD